MAVCSLTAATNRGEAARHSLTGKLLIEGHVLSLSLTKPIALER